MAEKTSSHHATPGGARIRQCGLGIGSYILVTGLLVFAAQSLGAISSLRENEVGPFLAVGLTVGALWTFGWGGGEWLAERLAGHPIGADGPRSIRRSIVRALIPGIFSGAVYLLLAVPLRATAPEQLLMYCALPAALAGMFEALPPGEKLSWQDLCVLAGLALPIEYSGLRAPRGTDLGGLPKLLLTDIALYLYVIQRHLPGIGMDLRVRVRDLFTGLRAWATFAPIGIGLGLALGFLRWHARLPGAGPFCALMLVSFLFVAVPEEVFFRGLLQNLLLTRLPRRPALALASVLFGLAHYVHGPVFNWRYVILAAIAGGFYGRAWLRDRRVSASAIAHALVDVVWVTWFLNPGAL